MNFESAEGFGAKAPGPISGAPFFVPGLVDVQMGLLGEQVDQLRVGRAEGRAAFCINLAKYPRETLKPSTSVKRSWMPE